MQFKILYTKTSFTMTKEEQERLEGYIEKYKGIQPIQYNDCLWLNYITQTL